jgi:hypothetical protein
MFGGEFISIILRTLSSIQPALRNVNRNSGANALQNSVKNYISAKAAMKVADNLEDPTWFAFSGG